MSGKLAGATKENPSILNKTLQKNGGDNLHQLAFDNSALANIISIPGNGKILNANTAACKLLGYSKKELLTKSRHHIFDIREISFKKMLKERNTDGKATALVSVVKKNGVKISCEIYSAIFKDEQGMEKAITAVTNISKRILILQKLDKEKEKLVAKNIKLVQAAQNNIDFKKEKKIEANIVKALEKSEKKSAAHDEWIKYIGKSSYDIMWDWNVVTNEVYVGDSVEEVFGYRVQKNTVLFKNFTACLIAPEKKRVLLKIKRAISSSKKHWDDCYLLKRKDATVATTTSRAVIVRDELGKAIRFIGATMDTTRLLEMEKIIEQQLNIQQQMDEKLLITSKLSFDVIWDWDLITNNVLRGEGFVELLGLSKKNSRGHINDWRNYIHPEDKVEVEEGLQKALASTASHWEHAFRFIRANGTIARVFDRANIIRDAQGKPVRMIGVMQDLSKQQELEEKLATVLQLKEKQIEDAAAEAKESERSFLGKELHDNINQLLGASKMYLEMAKRGGNKSKMYLSRSSEYTMTAIEAIRKLSKGLITDVIKFVGLCEAITKIADDIAEANTVKISFLCKTFNEKSVDDKFKLNILRIIQEQMSNIIKHAAASKIFINLFQNKKKIILTVTDNGVGFNTGIKQNGIGIANIKNRVLSFNGRASFASAPGKGCTLKVEFSI